jgi:D-alanyl-D-alanine carboxypeptidase
MRNMLPLIAQFLVTAISICQTKASPVNVLQVLNNGEALANNEVALAPFPADTIVQIDNLVAAYMKKYNLPGLSLAISKDGKLVYVKGYGYANKSTREKVSPSSLFRVASLSKAFTSVAIMQLIEGGRLSLDAKVFGDNGILGNEYGIPPTGTGITKITVHELLQHTGGGWSNDTKDPMFTNPSFTAAQLISWTLNNIALENEPGKNFAYSNFGYCVLGRVIEKITGIPYAVYVRDSILRKVGIDDMQIAGNTRADKKRNEVVYYGSGVENPYNNNIARMDAHGGWIATATDLVQFILHVDGFDNVPDILTPSSITIMTTPSAANLHYACGWQVNNANNWWHTGSLPGTATEMVRANNGFAWAILVNTRTNDQDFKKDMDRLIWYAVRDTTIHWKGM